MLDAIWKVLEASQEAYSWRAELIAAMTTTVMLKTGLAPHPTARICNMGDLCQDMAVAVVAVGPTLRHIRRKGLQIVCKCGGASPRR